MRVRDQQTGEILVLNAGSSSLKFALFSAKGRELSRELDGQVEGIGIAPRLTAKTGDPQGVRTDEAVPCNTGAEAVGLVLDWLRRREVNVPSLLGVGHRIVHGGSKFGFPVMIDRSGLAALDDMRSLAPLHNGFGIDTIHAMLCEAPGVLQVACFDTAFHQTQPDVATRFALPRELHDEGYRRYGFHGLSYEHVVAELPQVSGASLPARLLVFHLGNGCSLCAIENGKSVATTMGYSTLDGLVMGTRSGSIDPGVLIALVRNKKMNMDALEDLLYRKSGLLGISGVASDMRELLTSKEPECSEAVRHFCYWAARHASSAVTAMGGLEAVVFTGGIGANSPAIRSSIAAHLRWLGLTIDKERNWRNEGCISPAGSERPVWIVPANEERAIARHTLMALKYDPAWNG